MQATNLNSEILSTFFQYATPENPSVVHHKVGIKLYKNCVSCNMQKISDNAFQTCYEDKEWRSILPRHFCDNCWDKMIEFIKTNKEKEKEITNIFDTFFKL